jgi:allantoate deiminase
MTYSERAQNILGRLDQLAACSDDENSISRMFGTKAFLQAQQTIKNWMEEAGLETTIDNIGNVRGVKVSKDPSAKTFVVASHFDSVKNAGKFDGPLGVVMGIDLAATNRDEQLPFHLEIIAFSDEEGVRFHSTFLGSRVVAGMFDEQLLAMKDELGSSLGEVISQLGYDPSRIEDDQIAPDEWLGYFEVHIEQGPVLYESDDPVAVVTHIAGQKRQLATVKGVAGHAGTVPMNIRQDALCCAAEIILAIEAYGISHHNNIVATVGKLEISNAASNVIPGEASFTIDVRSADWNILVNASSDLAQIAKAIAAKREVELTLKDVQETRPVTCDVELVTLLKESIASLGYNRMNLVSGAGHDAVAISEVAPVSMLFVRCYKGISHNPLEDVELKDIEAAIAVCDKFILNLVQKVNNNEWKYQP